MTRSEPGHCPGARRHLQGQPSLGLPAPAPALPESVWHPRGGEALHPSLPGRAPCPLCPTGTSSPNQLDVARCRVASLLCSPAGHSPVSSGSSVPGLLLMWRRTGQDLERQRWGGRPAPLPLPPASRGGPLREAGDLGQLCHSVEPDGLTEGRAELGSDPATPVLPSGAV